MKFNLNHSKFLWILVCSLLGFSGFLAASDEVDETKAAVSDGLVRINIVRGHIRVEGWSEDKIKVVGTLDEETKKFVFEVNGSETIIAVKIPNKTRSWCCNEGSDLRIMVPENSQVEIGVVSANVRVEKIYGGLDIGGVSGDIQIRNISGRIKVTSVSGELEAEKLDGRTRLKTVSGDIEVDSAKGTGRFHTVSGNLQLDNVGEDLDLESVSGDIEVQDTVIRSIRGHTVSGDIDLQVTMLDAAILDFDSVSGSIRLDLSGELDGRYRFETASGSIRNRLSDDRAKKNKYVRDETLRFSIGKGHGDFTASTRSGDIVIDRD